jgi:hypothetical protein
MLRLREIDRSSTDTSERQLQQRFEEESRTFSLVDVVSRERQPPTAAAADVRPSWDVCIARSTAKRGYLQVVQLSLQTFSVFLTHIDDIPMEAAIRCLRFAPCLAAPNSTTTPLATGSADTFPCPVVYSLAFSNQLLVGDLNNGNVTILDEYPCRPSTIFADGSVVVVGDGRGRVHAYRGGVAAQSLWKRDHHTGGGVVAHGASQVILWSTAVSLHPVTLIESVRHAYFVAATANFNVLVLDASTGTLLSSLISESSALTFVMPSAGPFSAAAPTDVALCYDSGVVSTFRCHEPSGGETWSLVSATRRTPTQRCGGQVWSAKHGRMMDVIGTTCGQVILYEQGSPKDEPQSRVDVNDAVLSVHVVPRPEAPDAVTVVCTVNGSLWQWTLDELALTADDGDNTPPLPEPQAYKNVTASNDVTHEVPRHTVEGIDAASEDLDIGGLVNHVLEPHSADNQAPQVAAETRGDDRDVIIEMDGDDVNACDEEGTPSIATTEQTLDSMVPSSVALTAATHNTTHEDLLRQRGRPNHNVRFAQTIGEGNTRAPTADHETRGTNPAVHMENSPHVAPTATTAHEHFAAQDRANTAASLPQRNVSGHHASDVSTAVSIPGLKQGRRWDPRHITSVLQRSSLKEDGQRPPYSVPVDQSTAAVEAEDARLANQSFDFDAYAAAHPLEVQALRYMHPIRNVSFQPNESLFSPMQQHAPEDNEASSKMQTGHNRELFPEGSGGGLKPTNAQAPTGDDLIDATFHKLAPRRDRQRQQQQASVQQGPSIRDHLCYDILVPPPPCAPAAIFFSEYKVPLTDPPLLTMPMPMPPSAVSAM